MIAFILNIGRRKSSTNKRSKVSGSGRKKAKLSSGEEDGEEVDSEGEIEADSEGEEDEEEEGEAETQEETKEEPKVLELHP